MTARRSAAPAGDREAAAFSAAVFDVVHHIPAGRVATYGDVARLAGKPRAARLVGRLMATSTLDLPYHRVVAAGGLLGGYGSGAQFKAARLTSEGVIVRRGRIADFRARRWQGEPPEDKARRPVRRNGSPASPKRAR